LLQVVVNGRLLTDTDIVSILRNWTAGDLASMAAALGVVVHFLASHPRIQEELRTNSGDLGSAIDPDTRIYLNWTSANRDETVFGDPDAYRPEEHAPHNLVYGAGMHACPGRPLATLELVVAVQTLLSVTTRVELAADSEPVRETYPLGGWQRLPVRLH
jgi:cytochrome P450